MECSDLQQQRYFPEMQQRQFQLQHHPKPRQSGLTRFQSAPSSYLGSLMDPAPAVVAVPNTKSADFVLPRPLSPETEAILSRFIHSVASDGVVSDAHKLVVKHENEESSSSQGINDSNNPVVVYPAHHHQPSSNKPPVAGGGQQHRRRMKSSGNRGLAPPPRSYYGLMRHNSSPAGLFDDIHIEHGGSTAAPNEKINIQTPKSNSNLLPVSNMGGGGQFQLGSDDDDVSLVDDETKAPLKRLKTESISFPWDDDDTMFSDLFLGGGEVDNHPSSSSSGNQPSTGVRRDLPRGILAHHMSLPKATLEKLLQFEDSVVPCKVRAKRGCATHPRSIAERVRRTKISDRIRKLQVLVPNMDKQTTSTAEMLDFAAEHIKDLQYQVKMLTDKRARCTCTSS